MPGLTLTTEGLSGEKDICSVLIPALSVLRGEAPSPFVEPGQFKAKWEGFLGLEARSRLYFSFTGKGEASLEIDGEEVLSAALDAQTFSESERLRLNSGPHQIKVTYLSLPDGEARFRFYWRGRDFARETIPGHAFSKNPGTPIGDELRAGRSLVARYSCTRCHKDSSTSAQRPMPELLKDTPSFSGIGSRLEKAWIAAWVQDPKAHRANANMPMLHAASTPTAASDIAEWLALDTGETPSTLPSPSSGDLEAGKHLFHALGCMGCHDTDGKDKGNANGNDRRIQLSAVGHKYKAGALRDFLKHPGKHYQWIRMPDFSLSDKEATLLAQYLRSLPGLAPPGISKGDASRGKVLVREAGCLACHSSDPNERPAVPDLAHLDIEKGCLSTSPGKAPDYGLEGKQRQSIQLFLSKARPSLARRSLPEFALRQVQELQCTACHQGWGKPSHLSSLPDITTDEHPSGDIEAETRVAGRSKPPPDLTLAGEKLKAGWMESLFTAKLPYKPRPWMEMRMPAFHSRGSLMAKGLSGLHGFHLESQTAGQNGGQAELGKKLVSANGGFACVACHASGNQPALAPFEGQGLNFAYTRDRLTHEYYLRWMLNPQRILPQSIMPRYSDAEGRSTLADILGGSAQDQFNAIWQYIQTTPERE